MRANDTTFEPGGQGATARVGAPDGSKGDSFGPEPAFYSARSAIIGSTRVARRAGISVAASATAVTSATTEP
jgi:hypothetical protein